VPKPAPLSACIHSKNDPLNLQDSKKSEICAWPPRLVILQCLGVHHKSANERVIIIKRIFYCLGIPNLIFEKGRNPWIFFCRPYPKQDPKTRTMLWERDLPRRIPRNNFRKLVWRILTGNLYEIEMGKPEIIAGYLWFGWWGRDTSLVAAPGLTLQKETPQKTFHPDIMEYDGRWIRPVRFSQMLEVGGNDEHETPWNAPLMVFLVTSTIHLIIQEDSKTNKKNR